MKKSMMIKIFGIIVLVFMLVFVSSCVFAATNDDDYTDLIDDNSPNSQNGNTNNQNANTNNQNANTNNQNTNTNNQNTNRYNNPNTNPLNTSGIGSNNANSYDNSNLPSTGIQDSIPTVLLIVIFTISAIYAYKKIKDYQQL